ncbi:hypothetical protein K437DRAFT_234554 [Tilletiaria anomala UBC 951]|uniref:Uncharacterized protein n=1 Tax=Tilletiaria anomala (strain ATCC 24038 / CBS 436.72 / UBC 951) TaxID=1037660 RepID=A0A066W9H7_TILAU|nr:uncharacterized protein K437DRAFT_234554 [Tilletiaria anomala UBC 951]KDN47734.1 hypothetical protein K437DRAFT_234554 [Tilletiaria anomala UBC 951]
MSNRNSLMLRRDGEQGGGKSDGDALKGWVGAFERVLGDQAEALSRERRQQQQQSKQVASTRSAIAGETPSLLQSQSHLLADDSRVSKAERSTPSASRASSVHSSASIRAASERGSRGAESHELGSDSGYLLPRAALASHPGSEAGTDASEQSGLVGGARSNASYSLHRAAARKALCNDLACAGQDSGDELTAQLDTTTSGPSLITLLGPPYMAMEDLYLNHAPGLQKLSLSNLTPSKVQVRLDSDMGDALSFMRTKDFSEGQEMDRVPWPSNSVVWARGDGLSPAKLRDMRQISASLEEVSNITIEGSSSIALLVLFRPKRFQQHCEDKQRRRRSTRFVPSPRSEPANDDAWQVLSNGSQANSSSASSQASYQSSPRTTVTESRSPPFDGHLSPTPFKNKSSSRVSLDFHELQHVNHRVISQGTLLLHATKLDASEAPLQDESSQSISVPFRAAFCKPQLGLLAAPDQPLRDGGAVIPDASGAMTFHFGDLTVGTCEQFRLSLQNLSQIECCWQARLEDADNVLSSTPLSLKGCGGDDIQMINQSRDKLFCPYWVRPFSSQEISIQLDAREACRQFHQTITLTNLHDTSNNFKLVISANILGIARDKELDMSPAEVLDFGDCCGGQWTKQIVVLKNQGDSMLNLSFSASKEAEVTFELAKVVAESHSLFDSEHLQSVSTLSCSEPNTSASENASISEYSSRSEKAATRSGSEEEGRTPAFESMRTPMSKAQDKMDLEPPPLALSVSVVCVKKLQKMEAEKPAATEADDTDAFSNVSQAGSQQGSPALGPKDSVVSPIASSNPSGKVADLNTLAMAAIGEPPGKHPNTSQRDPSTFLSSHPSIGFAHRQARPDQVAGASDRGDEVQSVISEVTTTSHDSKRSIFAPASSQAIGPLGVISGSSRGPHPLSGFRKIDHTPTHHLEESFLAPGAETRILVSYRPAKGDMDDEVTAGRLREVTFPIFIDSAKVRVGGPRSSGPKTRRSLLCKARACTSFIAVTPRLIDFGETNVGARKTATLSVTNRSELTARVDVRFVSKVLSMYRGEVPIPPLQTVDLKVDFFPRRINDSYRKQITVTNLLNRDNDQIFDVRSTNVDQQRVTFHSLLYRILTATGANFIDFGDVNINSTRVRSFSVENISGAPLLLELTAAHPEDLVIYVKAPEQSATHHNVPATSATLPPTRYAEVELSDKVAPTTVESQRPKPTSKGPQLKERFLETISMDSPTSIRKENASWRLAQKQAQAKKRVREESVPRDLDAKAKPSAKSKPVVNLVSAMRKGGKGKITLKYGKSMMFKDKKALAIFEHLDLACGPPVDPYRIPAKSKLYQQLDQLASPIVSFKLNTHGTPSGVGPACAVNPGSSEKGLKARREAAGGEKAAQVQIAARQARAPALTGQRCATRKLADFSDVSKLTLDELITALESQNSTLHTFFLGDPDAEERQVRSEINLQRQLSLAISERHLLSTEVVSLMPEEEIQIIALYTPNGSTRPHVQGNARKQDSRIFLRLLQFDETLVQRYPDLAPMAKVDKEELPVRDLIVKTNTCRSIMELGQPHINFGQMDKGESKARKIVIQNRSEWALRYCIRKSGSIASGDIKIAMGRYGIIPGYGKREVQFVFSPSMSGQFQEKLVVENVADRDNDQTLILKANIRKVSNFVLEPSVVMLGACQVGQLSEPCSFTISNTSTKTRTFMVDVDRQELQHHRCIVDIAIAFADDADTRGALTQAEEEEVEHISQKLKIATRKGQADKVKKYETRLLELGISVSPSGPSDAVKDLGTGSKADAPPERGPRLKRFSTAVTFALEASQTRKMVLRLRLRRVHTALGESHSLAADLDSMEEISTKVRVYEAKNADDTKTVLIRAQAKLDPVVNVSSDQGGDEELADMPANALVFSTHE